MNNGTMVVYLNHINGKCDVGVLYQDFLNDFAVITSTKFFAVW